SVSPRLWSVARLGVRVALVVMAVAFVMNTLGFVGLARFMNNGLLRSAYMALVLNAALSVTDALIGAMLHVRPLTKLRLVQRYRPLLRRRTFTLLRWGAVIWWFLSSLEVISLKRPFLDGAGETLSRSWSLGAATISIGGVLTFGMVIAGAFLLSRFLRFLLEEDIYPRVRLARGVPFAMSTMLHYVILLVGFILAVAALGYDMTKFTILAGAFGVGLGFGMQNIVNNFVSGLILLFERPVQVGDIIQMDVITGVVTHIGIRASIVKVGDGSEVVVPNGKLIADRFTNWTLTDRKRRLDVVITVTKDADPASVIRMANEVAAAHPLVAQAPAPQTFLTEFVAGGMKFELRVWTNRFEDARPLRSDLAVAVHKALIDSGVALL
ncbi:MAG TPA: mechanosensitive ion channel domain-containing protein, partial [Verrucomicrobium sp.]|nr:mechanosensitive ion channel domain-containing protein [Verrucomicrobium sp.]